MHRAAWVASAFRLTGVFQVGRVSVITRNTNLTKEVHMSDYKDMPLDTTLQVGDIITITGPGDHDMLVREVTKLSAFDNCDAIVAGMVGPTATVPVILEREGRTLTRIQRPAPALPTVPGYYERVRFPISRGYFAIRLDEHGKWHREGMRVTEEQLRVSYLPLTRLVPETAPSKLADRLDLYELGKEMRNAAESSSTWWKEDAARIVAAIDNGELDK